MFIVWGSKGTSTNLGYAADFCPVCRSIQAFRIIRVGRSGHVYGISVGSGDLIGHNRACIQCGVVMGANPANYKEMAKRPGKQDIDALIRSTFPNIATHHAERLKLEAYLREHPDKLDPALRTKLLIEPFQLMEHIVQARFAKSNIDGVMIAIMIATVFLVTQLSNIVKAVPFLSDSLGALIIGTFVAGGIALFMQGRHAGRQFMHKKIYPVLTGALQPLKPNENELRSILAMLAKSKATMAKKVSLPELMQSFGKSRVDTQRVAPAAKVIAQ